MKPGVILATDEQLEYAILAKRIEIRMGDKTEYIGVILSHNHDLIEVRDGYFIKGNIEIRTI